MRDSREVSILLDDFKHAVTVVGSHAFCAPGDHVSLKMEWFEAQMAVVGPTNKDGALKLILNLIREGLIHIRYALFVEKVRTVLDGTFDH
jgi:hypothetical protein